MASTGKDLYDLGLAREAAGDMAGAFESFRRSAKADPLIAAPYVGLARLLLRNQQRGKAIACLDRALACEPRNPLIHSFLGRALAQDGDLEGARERFETALALAPPSEEALLGLAGVHEDAGRKAEAVAAYRRLLALRPRHAEALAGLLGVDDGDGLSAAFAEADALLKSTDDRSAAVLGYALGKALSRTGDDAAAFAAWATANGARRRLAGPFDTAANVRHVERMREIFSPGFFEARKDWGDPSDRPVFVVGLPRSGTTLVEQILAGHPQVHGAGELDALADLATATPDRLGRADLSWPETVPQLNARQVEDIGWAYLARIGEVAPPGALRVADKQPLNFWHLGLVAVALPNARIIHCRRDIRDNGLSIFAEDFTHEQRWATDLGDIADYWRGYRRLMDHWRQVAGLEILEVDYEATVGDLPGQARRMLDFLGLPWDPSVTAFHKTERSVQTPSRWQVRQPLYSSSVARWRRHEAHLGPLVEAAEADL